MQHETPQPNQPAPQAPPKPAPPQDETGGNFYTPANPAPFAASAQHVAPPSLPAAPVVPAAPQTLSWEASEYIHNDKGSLWIVGLVTISLAVAGIAFYLQAWTFLVLVVVMAVAMGIFAFRPPHIVQYTLNENGVRIGDKMFNYSDFRAFGIMQDGAFFTMTLIPVKRFAPALSVYFAEAQGEDIVDIVGAHLPMEHVEPDVIDRMMHRLRF